MKKSLFILLFCGSLLTLSHSAFAQQARVGVGAMLNDPTGLSAKVWMNESLAVDGAFSFGLSDNASQLYIHTDILKHLNMKADHFQLYYGLGLRFLVTDVSDDFISGLRVPGGMAYSIPESDLETFFELAPTIDFSPDFRFLFAGALGIRIYLN